MVGRSCGTCRYFCFVVDTYAYSNNEIARRFHDVVGMVKATCSSNNNTQLWLVAILNMHNKANTLGRLFATLYRKQWNIEANK